MRAVVALALIAATALAAPRIYNRAQDIANRRSTRGQVNPGTVVASSSICDNLAASDKSGAWWCSNGNGGQPGGSVALSLVGSPALVTFNGASQYRLNPTATSDNQYLQSAVVAAPTGSFTACAIYTKIDQANADYANFSDHAGSYGYILQDNGVTSKAYLFSATAQNSTMPTAIEAMECTVFTSGVSTSICVYAASEFTGCSAPTTVTDTHIDATPYRWLLGGGAIAGYNLRGFLRGGFFTEKVLTNADLVRISTPILSPNPPSGWVAYVDAADADKRANSTYSNADPVGTWDSLSAVTDWTTGTDAGSPRINTTDKSVSYSGIQDYSTSLGGAADYTFIHNTGIFDVALTVRRRGTSLAGAPRRVIGNASSAKGIYISNDAAGHFVVNVYNGTSDIAAFTSALAAPIGVPTSVLVRGDGTNIKITSNFSTFESQAFSGSPGGGNAAAMSIGASGTGETAGIDRYDGDISQVLIYSSNLSPSQLTALSAYLTQRRGGQGTQHVWAAVGDSLTEGLNTVYPWPHRVTEAERASGIAAANHGKSGDDTAGATTRWTNYMKSRGYYGVVLAIGVNDILNGVSAATVEVTYAALIADIQSSGLKVVVCTITPFKNYSGYSAGKEAQRLLFNTWIRGLAVDAVVDEAATMASPVDTLNPAYDIGDGLHFNDTGNAAYAAPVSTAIGAL